jgi:GT2 family glycosyltransferase
MILHRKISVIIPVYNHSELLMAALRNLSLQTYQPYEIIVTDDGSSEDIENKLKDDTSFLKTKLVYVKQSDHGFRLAKCKNNGARLATGDILVFNDQDIVSTKGYLSLYNNTLVNKFFIVAYPVRLNLSQTSRVLNNLDSFSNSCEISIKQKYLILRQYIKDSISHKTKKIIKSESYKPKLRGGTFGISLENFYKVNGFDESYVGWGREDDDLGRRLNFLGIIGKSIFLKEYPIHLYHPINPTQANDINYSFYKSRTKEIKLGDYQAKIGLSNPLDNEELHIVEIN